MPAPCGCYWSRKRGQMVFCHLHAAAEEMLAALQTVFSYAEKTGNCNICACDHDDHADDCPVMTVLDAIDLAEGKES